MRKILSIIVIFVAGLLLYMAAIQSEKKVPETRGILQYFPWIETIPFEETSVLGTNCGDIEINPTWISSEKVDLGEGFNHAELFGEVQLSGDRCQKVQGEILKIDPEYGVTILFYFHTPPGYGDEWR